MVTPLEADDTGTLGPYRLLRQLGDGGVYLGLPPDGQPVAVQAISAELAADPGFRAEVAAARTVSTAFVAPVVDADLDSPVPWLASRYVAGPSLAEAVREHGPSPVPVVLGLAAALAEGLRDMHAAGLLHRNLKPSNVVLAQDGPRLIGYGIWNAAELPGKDPGFLSPEQVLGHDFGPASDIFSLGTVLAFAGSGHGPFGSGSIAALMYRLVNSPAQLDGLGSGLRPIVADCLAKRPSDRPTAGGLLAELAAVRSAPAPEPEQVPAPVPVPGGPGHGQGGCARGRAFAAWRVTSTAPGIGDRRSARGRGRRHLRPEDGRFPGEGRPR